MVKAREIGEFPSPPDEEARFFGQPGDMVPTRSGDGSRYGFLVACPSCGQFGAICVDPREHPHWLVSSGSLDDVTTLSLQPSILKGCCGWHGYLSGGQFHTC